jgi:hypothetical protein
MDSKKLIFILMILPFSLSGHNLSTCDSLEISCCSFDINQNTISLIASNYSGILFDYPGFILLNTDSDTLAFETVNYYGIGLEQMHILDIVHPFSLPLEGILQLHTFFYDSLACTFEVFIPDTVATGVSTEQLNDVKIFPNPASDYVLIHLNDREFVSNYKLRIINNMGQQTYSCLIDNGMKQVPVDEIGPPGFYFIQVMNQKGKIIASRKLSLK